MDGFDFFAPNLGNKWLTVAANVLFLIAMVGLVNRALRRPLAATGAKLTVVR